MPFKKVPPLYWVWRSMRDRCSNPNFKQWKDYGGRGIAICKEWDSYAEFERDMSPRPPGTSLERIDTDGDYGPSNCRWATSKEQQRNQRRTIYVTIESSRYKAIELAEMSGLKVDTIVARASKGMPYDAVVAKTRYNYTGAVRKAIATRVANQLAATHCKRGHAWVSENTRYTTKGQRYCRLCDNENARALRARKSASI
jgi:hypothetical protein